MIYESDRNMPLQPIRESYYWARERPCQEKALVAIRNGDTRLLAEALLQGAQIISKKGRFWLRRQVMDTAS